MSTSPYFEIVKPGLYTVWQDSGRQGYRHLGVPLGGAMDLRAFSFVNECLGLDKNHPVLEITMIGPEIRFEGDVPLCISGAECEVFLDGVPVPLHRPFHVRSGQVLSYGRFINGCRSYLAIAADIEVEKIIGSVSPFPDTHLQPLKKNDRIIFHPYLLQKSSAINLNLNLSLNPQLMASPGPEWHWLTHCAQTLMKENSFTITHEANSIGYRLKGPVLQKNHEKELLSSAVMPGTVQLLPDGQVIVLMRNCQTTGGYPRILQLDENSINMLAQLRPGESISFITEL